MRATDLIVSVLVLEFGTQCSGSKLMNPRIWSDESISPVFNVMPYKSLELNVKIVSYPEPKKYQLLGGGIVVGEAFYAVRYTAEGEGKGVVNIKILGFREFHHGPYVLGISNGVSPDLAYDFVIQRPVAKQMLKKSGTGFSVLNVFVTIPLVTLLCIVVYLLAKKHRASASRPLLDIPDKGGDETELRENQESKAQHNKGEKNAERIDTENQENEIIIEMQDGK